MSLPAVVLLGVSLSMDAFAIAVAWGFADRTQHPLYTIRTAAFFGFFQALMPIIGWLAGLSLRQFISAFDHWVAFGLLSAIGCKMIYEAFLIEKEEKAAGARSLLMLLMLSVATSIDALAVGLSLSVMNVAIVMPALVIGAITFALSLLGGYIGKRFGHFFEKGIEVVAGLILIGIGTWILIAHFKAPG